MDVTSLNAPVSAARERARAVLYHVAVNVLRPWCWLWHGFRVDPAHPACDARAMVVVANHVCMLDSVMVAIALWPARLRYLSISQNGTNRLYGWLVRELGCIFVEDGAGLAGTRRMAEALVTSLGAGHSVAIFPEGELVPWREGVGPFKEGAFRVAAYCRVPVLPVVVAQTARRGLCGLIRHKPGFEVRVGSPIKEMPELHGKAAALALETQARVQMETLLIG